MAAFASVFQSQLQIVEEQMNREIHFKSSNMEDLINLDLNDLDRQLCPALVLAIGNTNQQTDNRIISLAVVFQYIFLAHYIHGLVTDEDMAEQERQYPVLVGDFMFGQSLSKICEADLYGYAGQFVRAIETINEGILMRWRFKNKIIPLKDYRIIIGKERASLLALAGKLSGELAGVKEPYLKKMEDLGYYIGMAWGAWEESKYPTLVKEYLEKAQVSIVELQQHFPAESLRQLYKFFCRGISPGILCANIK